MLYFSGFFFKFLFCFQISTVFDLFFSFFRRLVLLDRLQSVIQNKKHCSDVMSSQPWLRNTNLIFSQARFASDRPNLMRSSNDWFALRTLKLETVNTYILSRNDRTTVFSLIGFMRKLSKTPSISEQMANWSKFLIIECVCVIDHNFSSSTVIWLRSYGFCFAADVLMLIASVQIVLKWSGVSVRRQGWCAETQLWFQHIFLCWKCVICWRILNFQHKNLAHAMKYSIFHWKTWNFWESGPKNNE